MALTLLCCIWVGVASSPDDSARANAAGVRVEGIAAPVAPAGRASEDRVIQRAGGAAAARGESPRAGRGAGPSLLAALWPLGIVLLVIAAAALLLKRALPRRRAGAGPGPIRIVARHHLSPRQSLCLVRLGRTSLLIGVTPEHIETLARLSDENESAELLGEAAAAQPGSVSDRFQEFLRRESGAYAEPPPEAKAGAIGARAAAAGEAIRDVIRRVRSYRPRTGAGRAG